MADDYSRIGRRIRELRETNDLSQQELAGAVGLSRPAISQIEKGERRICADELVKFSRALRVSIEALLGLEETPEVKLEETNLKQVPRQSMRIDVPQKNVEKFKEVFLYLLGRVGSKPNIGETVLYKLLYFIDFDYYEKYEEQLVGATYQKNQYGPTPIEFKKITEKMIGDGEIEKVKSSYFAYPQNKYLPRRRPDLSKLKASEIEVIDEVIAKLSDLNASQISDYSHNDVPWLTTENGAVIKYESVFYRAAPYSVRDYSGDVS